MLRDIFNPIITHGDLLNPLFQADSVHAAIEGRQYTENYLTREIYFHEIALYRFLIGKKTGRAVEIIQHIVARLNHLRKTQPSPEMTEKIRIAELHAKKAFETLKQAELAELSMLMNYIDL